MDEHSIKLFSYKTFTSKKGGQITQLDAGNLENKQYPEEGHH